MKSATLPVGKSKDFSYKTIIKGDILKLVTGETVIFNEMNRTRFNAEYNGRSINVPLWRSKSAEKPFVTEVLGHDRTKDVKVATAASFKPGDLFLLEGQKGVYMFIKSTGVTTHGMEISSRRTYGIRTRDYSFVPLDIAKLKKEVIG